MDGSLYVAIEELMEEVGLDPDDQARYAKLLAAAKEEHRRQTLAKVVATWQEGDRRYVMLDNGRVLLCESFVAAGTRWSQVTPSPPDDLRRP